MLLVSWLIQSNYKAKGQDLHFSQYFNAPLLINPANTGFIPDADWRIGGHFRNQWNSLIAAPYKTVSFFADAQLLRNHIENGWLGIGAYILSDQSGSGNLKSTKVYGSLAYHQQLGDHSLLSAGFNMGWANKRIDVSKLTFPSQFNGFFFDHTVITSDYPVLTNTSISYFDMQAGMNYAYFPDDEVYINAGYSISHVNKPQESFFSSNPDSSRIAMRHIGFVNALFKLNEQWIINPNLFYSNQARAFEWVIGMNLSYNLSEKGEKQLIAGCYYRVGDAAVPMIGFELNKLRFTFSYDVTTSSLNKFNNGMGASEFSLLKKSFYNESNADTRKVMCPSF